MLRAFVANFQYYDPVTECVDFNVGFTPKVNFHTSIHFPDVREYFTTCKPGTLLQVFVNEYDLIVGLDFGKPKKWNWDLLTLL